MKERFGFIVLTFLAVSLVAGLSLQAVAGKYQDEKKANRLEIRLSRSELKETTRSAKQLAHMIDLWHDANLKSDAGLIKKYEEKLHSIIGADVQFSVQKVRRFEAEVNLSVGEHQADQGNRVENKADYRAFQNNVADLKTARELAKVKEKLDFAVRNSESFSNKYRLLNDYLDILSREVGINRVELAEDFHEWEGEK